jgi:hypothetical protein
MKSLYKLGLLSLVLGYAAPASAGCGVELTLDNDLNTSIKVIEIEAMNTGGSWHTVYSTQFTVASGKKAVRAVETNGGCGSQHFRVKYSKGNGNNTFYKTKGPVATLVDKKINIEFDD